MARVKKDSPEKDDIRVCENRYCSKEGMWTRHSICSACGNWTRPINEEGADG